MNRCNRSILFIASVVAYCAMIWVGSTLIDLSSTKAVASPDTTVVEHVCAGNQCPLNPVGCHIDARGWYHCH